MSSSVCHLNARIIAVPGVICVIECSLEALHTWFSGLCRPSSTCVGVCVQTTIIRDGSGKSRGFGFVQFTSVDSVAIAVGASPHQLDADNRVRLFKQHCLGASG